MISDRLEKGMSQTDKPDLVHQVFEGSLQRHIVCSNAPDHKSEGKEKMNNISLDIYKKKHLEDALKSFFEVSRSRFYSSFVLTVVFFF